MGELPELAAELRLAQREVDVLRMDLLQTNIDHLRARVIDVERSRTSTRTAIPLLVVPLMAMVGLVLGIGLGIGPLRSYEGASLAAMAAACLPAPTVMPMPHAEADVGLVPRAPLSMPSDGSAASAPSTQGDGHAR